MAKASILIALIKDLGLNNFRFEQEIKAGNGSIQKLLESDGEISDNLINKIVLRYQDVSTDWLRTGKGRMRAKPTAQKKVLLEKIAGVEEAIDRLRDQVREIKKMV